MRKEQFIIGEHYHIFSRTILNQPLLKDIKSAERLKQAFLIANSTEAGAAFQFLRNREDFLLEKVLEIIGRGKKLVDVLCYSIMPDHYHLFLKETKQGGISNFIQRCNISIAKYINIKKDRRGPVFESRFRSKHIDTNEYLLHLSCYIHLNPLDILIGKQWREHDLQNWPAAKKKLLNYPWSSARAFIGNKCNDLILSGTDIILNQFKDSGDYESFLREWALTDIGSRLLFEK